MSLSRRTFTFTMAAASLYAGPLTYFTEDEAALLNQLANQIIPEDDAPGAFVAGVCFYIDKQLTGPLRRYAPTYRKSVPLFRAECVKRTGREFGALAFDEQTAFLKQIERDKSSPLSSFFSLVVEHAMQAFYGSPIHGGNRDGVSWKMLKIEDVMGGHAH
jgi:gluconate 2-dehydrogenase gamma chain